MSVTLLTGLGWGIVGAVAMVVVMQLAGGDAPPPFAVFWAKFVGDGPPADAMPQALLVHFGYGGVAGVVYALVFGTVDLGFPIDTYTGGVIWGVVWGVVLMIIGAVVWVNVVLDMNPDPQQMLSMGLAHLAYGLVLGLLGAAIPALL